MVTIFSVIYTVFQIKQDHICEIWAMAIKGLQGSYIRAIKGFKNPKGGSNPGGNYMATGASCHIVSSRLEPPLLGTPLFLKQTKKISPSF